MLTSCIMAALFRLISKCLLVLTILSSFSSSLPITSLYGPNDHVIELVDQNITAIANSNEMWVVEFYAHWCGYCIRFSPVWKEIAEKFKDWKGEVNIAALNCAEQDSCGNYDVRGTPTLRVFHPNSPEGHMGEDINTKEPGQIVWNILEHIEKAQLKSQLKTLPDLITFQPQFTSEVMDVVTENFPKLTAFVLDFPADIAQTGLGKRVLLELGNEPEASNMVIKSVPQVSAQMAFTNLFSGPMYLPAVIVMSTPGGKRDIFFPNPTLKDTIEVQIKNYLITLLKNGSSTETTTTSTTTSQNILTGSPNEKFDEDERMKTAHSKDVVDAKDLEKAIEYSIVNELPSPALLGPEQMNVIYSYLDILSRYAPVRKEIKDFLVSLREWPVRMGYRAMTGRDYKAKVDDLIRVFRPFDGTPEHYQRCNGTQPHLRGYPCSLWTLFHTLMTNAAIKGDPPFTYGGFSSVARTMVGYIKNFFTCKHCAANFALKVQTLGFLPTTPQDSVLWLWQIHNMANTKLKGDATEDPLHPKIIWPAPENCPKCRAGHYDIEQRSILPPVSIQGELWNTEIMVEYLYKVYREENVIPNNVVITDKLKEKRISELSLLLNETLTTLTPSVSREEEVDIDLTLQNLITINSYCKNLFKHM